MKIRIIGTKAEIDNFLWKRFNACPFFKRFVDDKLVLSVSKLYPSRSGKGIYRCYIDITGDFHCDVF